jgi:putative (di)nucleoside polyphosphate hydrolase
MDNYRKGVGAVIINKDKKVFMACRIDLKEQWQMPQGGIEANETEENAILREVFEETGIKSLNIIAKTQKIKYDLPKDVAKKLWNNKYKGQEQTWFFLEFIGDENEINLNSSAHPEFYKWNWVEPINLPIIIVDFKKQMYQTILEIGIKLKIF